MPAYTNIDQKENERGATSSQEISLKELILKVQDLCRFLLSRWVIIVLAGIIGGALGLTYSFLKKPVYNAVLSFALEDDEKSGSLNGALGLASQLGFNFGTDAGGAFSGDNLIELMKSRSMVERTLLSPIDLQGNRITLADLYISFNNLRKPWNDKSQLKNLHFAPFADRARFSLQQDSVLGIIYKEIIKNNLTVDKADKKLSIISVEVKSSNELFSKYFTEVLTKTVSNFYIDTKTKKASQNVNILQRQTDSVRRELNGAITGVAASVDVNPNPNPSLQILRVPAQHRQVDVQANQAILTQLVTNLEVAKVALRNATPLIQIIDTPILPLEKTTVGMAKGLLLGFVVGVLIIIILLISRRAYQKILV